MSLRVEVDRVELERIARARNVLRLKAFGSALSDDFDPGRSDVDLFVEFTGSSADPFDDYFGLKEDLEALFGREVDLVMTQAVRNPHFRDRAEGTAEDLYAA
jgi:uncharacterized protein